MYVEVFGLELDGIGIQEMLDAYAFTATAQIGGHLGEQMGRHLSLPMRFLSQKAQHIAARTTQWVWVKAQIHGPFALIDRPVILQRKMGKNLLVHRTELIGNGIE